MARLVQRNGHTAIYVGNGMVMESTSCGIRTTPIDEWIATFPTPSRAPNSYGWGWLPGFDLSTNKEPTSNLFVSCECQNS